MKTKSLASLKKTAWDLLSKVIRLSYADEWGDVDCYTCGKQMHWKPDPERNLEGAQAGHAIPGRTGAVLLDDEIIRPQCFYCNIRLRGNYTIFTTKLIEEKGMDWWKCKLVESKKVRKWNRVELEETIEKYREKLGQLNDRA